MQLAGTGVWGPPKDSDGAVTVLREALAAGVNHIDTSDYYGPHVTNLRVRDFHQDGEEATLTINEKGNRHRTIGIHFAAAEAFAEYLGKLDLRPDRFSGLAARPTAMSLVTSS
jgi:pyridoxine 4-dehydrogenase